MTRLIQIILALALAPSLAWGQAALRPDQIKPGTPDITTGMVGNQFHIGTTIPWHMISGATVLASDFSGLNANVIELTNSGPIDATLPPAIAPEFGDGAGFAIQVGAGHLTLHAQSGSFINGQPTIHLGPYQSASLASRGGNWYASMSLPQPPSQRGENVLADSMEWLKPSGGGLGPPGVAACPQSDDFLARADAAGPPLDDPHKAAYVQLICGLVQDGVWPKLDALWMTATIDPARANLNLVSSNYTLTPHGSPQFTADRGYEGQDLNTTIYLDTGFNPSVGVHQYTLNEAHVSVWVNNQFVSGGDGKAMGAANADFNGATIISPLAAGSQIVCLVNGNANITPQKVYEANSTQSTLCQMEAGNLERIVRNGFTLSQDGLTPTALPNANVYLLAWNINQAAPVHGGGWEIAEASIGAALSSGSGSGQIASNGTKGTGLIPRVCEYLRALGAQSAC